MIYSGTGIKRRGHAGRGGKYSRYLKGVVMTCENNNKQDCSTTQLQDSRGKQKEEGLEGNIEDEHFGWRVEKRKRKRLGREQETGRCRQMQGARESSLHSTRILAIPEAMEEKKGCGKAVQPYCCSFLSLGVTAAWLWPWILDIRSA